MKDALDKFHSHSLLKTKHLHFEVHLSWRLNPQTHISMLHDLTVRTLQTCRSLL